MSQNLAQIKFLSKPEILNLTWFCFFVITISLGVTGTPIGRGKLEDLYGLLLFLGVNPFRNRSLFRHCLQADHRGVMDRIAHLLCNIFWRSTKGSKIIREQLGIPEQQEIKVRLQFSSIERHFYQTQVSG